MPLPELCPITEQAARITQDNRDLIIVFSPYTDGKYLLSRSARPGLSKLNREDRAKLVTWIVDKHRSGDHEPLITTTIVEEVSRRPGLTYDQRVDRFFRFLRYTNFKMVQGIQVAGSWSDEQERTLARLAAWLELQSTSEVNTILDMISSEGLLSVNGSFFRLTAGGMRRLDSLSNPAIGSNQAFVAMWFDPEMNSAFDEGFEPAIFDNGYKALRIDKKEHSNKIDDEIISEIRKSRFIVADFTCSILSHQGATVGVPRGGVYYEAGFAQGLNIDVIWTVRSDCISHVHFDTRQYSHIVWNDPLDLRSKLRNRIGAVIGHAPYI